MQEKNIDVRLILENGEIFTGKAFGYIENPAAVTGEVVFTTGMAGYQEVLTDPAYAGQIVVMTYPLIGNYGINLEDMESDTPRLKGFIVREKCESPNNWRCEMTLDGFLKQNKITGVEGIDTRALTRTLRDAGTMRGLITTRVDAISPDELRDVINGCTGESAVREVTAKEKYEVNGGGPHIAVIDFGIKKSMLKYLTDQGCKLTVFPAFTTAEEILSVNPDGIFLSNGPGDPGSISEAVETVKLLAEQKPTIGVCLGHLILSMALGCEVSRLKFGHHGSNYPVKDLKSGRIYITSQNHEYVVTEVSDFVETTYVNVNDGSIEGIRHKTLPLTGVQFNPEAAPEPADTAFCMAQFIGALKTK